MKHTEELLNMQLELAKIATDHTETLYGACKRCGYQWNDALFPSDAYEVRSDVYECMKNGVMSSKNKKGIWNENIRNKNSRLVGIVEE